MLLDNNSKEKSVYQWIKENTEEGKLDIVTGYFTIGALSFLSKEINKKINRFRLILGNIANVEQKEIRAINLLNENVTADSAFELVKLSREAVEFLKQDKLLAKTLEPNFCHAKCYLFSPKDGNHRNKYYISGSSNLTESGVGLKRTNNVELNLAATGNSYEYRDQIKWFNELWNSEKAYTKKKLSDGKRTDFKKYLIEQIQKIFKEYSPKDVYYKILFELYGSELIDQDSPEYQRSVGRLENTTIYNALFDFQQKGAISLIRMLNKYNGAILADAVGLGKTWTALAVMKFYQLQGREVILICPKRIEYNWKRYHLRQESRFERDEFDFQIRFHTDLSERRMNSYDDRRDKFFRNDKPKLFVIDESHNLRNHKTNRYQFLVREILSKNEDVKVLLLSATPINNTLTDVGNQFKLLVKGQNNGFEESIGISSIDGLFKRAESVFTSWKSEKNPKIDDLMERLNNQFFELTDQLVVARTRKMIEGQESSLIFPKKNPPKNLYITPERIGDFVSFEDLFNSFPKKLVVYQLSIYAKPYDSDTQFGGFDDERWRDWFLVKMMYILMVKRLESSWYAFYKTISKIRLRHTDLFHQSNLLLNGESLDRRDIGDNYDEEIFEDDEFLSQDFEEILSKGFNKHKLLDIEKAGNLEVFHRALSEDIQLLDRLYENLKWFNTLIESEVKSSNKSHSVDKKLERLLQEIKSKQESGQNNSNKKVLIFTTYVDTAKYLYNQFKERGIINFAMVSGSESFAWDSDYELKKCERILERFAPYTNLFKGYEWQFNYKDFNDWKNQLKHRNPETYKLLEAPIDILISTDSLSEGQNLQDADMVINYDIHWNPVRVIQRVGRIDRLESPNKTVSVVNFWPTENINKYLNLQNRIEDRMALMRLVESEIIDEFSERLSEITRSNELERKQREKMLKFMELSVEDLDSIQAFGMEKLSLELFRQDLAKELSRERSFYEEIPKGIYSGFIGDSSICKESGIVVLLGYRGRDWNHTRKLEHDLIFLNNEGELVYQNRTEILNVLKHHDQFQRNVSEKIDNMDTHEIKRLSQLLKSYLNQKMKGEAKAIFDAMRNGSKKSFESIVNSEKAKKKYDSRYVELITWMVISL
ncbi:MAG: helicase-related protein [Flavobacteriaceae bacterium]|nr:helicase-related protein [Flavobacteriaceae bacterium]MCY4216777.1 helicase-related protein [Flavobacteriaceae bacterium]MCY4253978.1 helicase-related protein [Flavobacteriaceae bacterium]